MGTHLVMEGYNNFKAQHYAQGLVEAFRLPAAQQEQDGSWTNPPSLGMVGQRDYLPPADFKGAWDYQVVQAEQTVVLGKTL